jgi:NAD(P)H-flavin reductase
MYTAQQPETTRDIWVPVPYHVTQRNAENNDIVTLAIEPSSSESIMDMKPGQFNMLYAFGVGEIPISVSSLLDPQPAVTHTVQGVGAVSKALCEMKTGHHIGVRGPFGTPWPVEVSQFKDVVIMAGGLGIAPVRPLIEAIAYERDLYKEVNILYGSRDPDGIIFHQDVISLQSDPSINFLVTVDHSFRNWRGNVGVVTNLVEKCTFDPASTIAYICGPEIMMRYGAYSLIDAGIPGDQIYLSMERNMKCGFGHCGHCQYGSEFVCKDGPVFTYDEIENYLNIRQL